jgi:hypothetical protein
MERRRPQVFDRQQAFSNIMVLSERFGLTPTDMYALFKGQALVAASNPGLFGDERKGPVPEPADDEEAPSPTSRVGGMAALRSEPPTPTRN